MADGPAEEENRSHHEKESEPPALAAQPSLYRTARRVVVAVIGVTVMLLMAPLVGLLPGPGGIPVLIVGLAILATEFVWAQRLLKRVRTEPYRILRRMRNLRRIRAAVRRWRGGGRRARKAAEGKGGPSEAPEQGWGRA